MRDGEVGQIQGLVIDLASRQVTRALVEKRYLWGRSDVAIPISAGTRLGEIFRLTISKQQPSLVEVFEKFVPATR